MHFNCDDMCTVFLCASGVNQQCDVISDLLCGQRKLHCSSLVIFHLHVNKNDSLLVFQHLFIFYNAVNKVHAHTMTRKHVLIFLNARSEQ